MTEVVGSELFRGRRVYSLPKGGTRIPPCELFEDWDAEDASEPGRACLGTVGIGPAPHSEGFLQAFAWKENLESFWEPPPRLDWPSKPGKW